MITIVLLYGSLWLFESSILYYSWISFCSKIMLSWYLFTLLVLNHTNSLCTVKSDFQTLSGFKMAASTDELLSMHWLRHEWYTTISVWTGRNLTGGRWFKMAQKLMLKRNYNPCQSRECPYDVRAFQFSEGELSL